MNSMLNTSNIGNRRASEQEDIRTPSKTLFLATCRKVFIKFILFSPLTWMPFSSFLKSFHTSSSWLKTIWMPLTKFFKSFVLQI